jgi:hypothetical protein
MAALEDLTLEPVDPADDNALNDVSLTLGYGMAELGASTICSCPGSCSCCCCC